MFVNALWYRTTRLQGLYLIHYYEHIWKYHHFLLDSMLEESIESPSGTLNLIDLAQVKELNLGKGKLYYSAYGIFVNFVLEQYAYRHIISAQEGDYVIDGGACYGDTALYFAHKVGNNGHIYSFEFNPENLKIFHKNIALNPQIHNITLLEHPLYIDSQTKVYSQGKGGGAKLSLESQEGQEYVMTASIDDLVEQGKIERVDFIKMDIEGSELPALKGAEKTLLKYNPKLAICLYHSESDYVEIPLYLKNLLPHYEFYCDHFSLGLYESVLFGKPKNMIK